MAAEKKTQPAPAAPAPTTTIKQRVTRLEEQIGCAPDVLGNPGAGVVGKLATMDVKLDSLLEADAKKRAATAWLVKGAALPVFGGLAGWALHWLSGLHH